VLAVRVDLQGQRPLGRDDLEEVGQASRLVPALLPEAKADGARGCAPYQASAQGVPSGVRPRNPGIAVADPQS
jgi:hypothetical protein